ncbi:MAG TPA: LysR family transcriptional regulator [Dongiaceae bacterium]|nr:LysR family transcriptional regulator [Dongiaceae bacterium]
MDRLTAMQIFVRVADLSSFTGAADALGLPKAVVSAAVQQLETRLGTRLLHRTTRTVRLTQDGATFHARCLDLLADADELDSLFHQTPASLSGRLRVDMPTGIARNLVIPRLPDFLAQHPGIELELSSTDRRVDLIQEGFDCVLRVGSLTDSGLIARPLGQMRIINCVSPGYIARWGEPKTLEDLPQHRLVHYVPALGAKSEGWEYWDGQRYSNIAMAGSLTVNNADAYLHACLAGLGIIQTPVVGVQPYLQSGELMEVLQDFQSEPMPVTLLYPHRRHLSRRAQVFMDWLAELATSYLEYKKS